MTIGNVLLVGGGNMGRALAEGFMRHSIPAQAITVVEPAAEARARLGSALTCVDSADSVPDTRFAAVIFAVKPQQMASVAGQYQRLKTAETVFISIAAGCSLQFLADHLGTDAALVRAMPNTPAAIGQGITVLCANAAAGPAQRELASALLGSVGAVAWLDDEALMDAVTAVSGSGPAYVFLLIESLAAAGARAGLPAELALQLARHTVAGAGQLALASASTPTELRRQVTSPGGTTQAALAVLREHQALEHLIDRAVAAAAKRSQALAAN